MFRVVVDPSSLTQAAGGAVAGQLHVETDDLCFPDDGWWDFPLVVLGWWLTTLRTASASDFELRFMDGPFRINCSRRDDRVEFVCVRGGAAGDTEVGWGSATATEMDAGIDAAARAVVAFCLAASLPTGGLEQLLDLDQ